MNALQLELAQTRAQYAEIQAQIDALLAQQRELLAHDQAVSGIFSKWEAFLELGFATVS
jgi:uncharacterized protein (DUF3084 family)